MKTLNPTVFGIETEDILSLLHRGGHSCKESNLAAVTQSSDRTYQEGLWDLQRRDRSFELGRGTLGQSCG